MKIGNGCLSKIQQPDQRAEQPNDTKGSSMGDTFSKSRKRIPLLLKLLLTIGIMLIVSLSTVGLVQGCSSFRALNDNSITSLEPNTFAGLTSLKSLYLSSNSITSIEPGTFSEIKSLEYLYMGDNSITSIDSNAFYGLTSLRYLSLQDNNINSIEPNTFSGLTSLEDLDLSDNSITSIEENVFLRLTFLQNL
ncbi:leucine-rich repeat-containing protein 15-like [Mytilus trossulus]|uniref:leucine-rich repeat-containing protein 15-like n=1 Tax=Mytilus trossulus TaxID=6551 RepID=UPI003003AD6A